MTENEIISLFKCLADKSRLQILRSLLQEDMYVERLSERLNLSPATISFHLKKLEEAGAVSSKKEQYYMIYSICKKLFDVPIISLLSSKPDELQLQHEREELYRKKVIDAFFEYGKLRRIPAQKKKEKIILEEIAKVFEFGRTYTEKEVNLLIADYFDDFCTIRRDMIGEHILKRDGINYWLNDNQ